MAKILVAMSGGIDSYVAAALLKEKGYDVTGVTMKVWDGEVFRGNKTRHSCYGPGEEEDIKDAGKVAQVLGIPFHSFDLGKEYKTEVLDYFCHEYLLGRTPNPCIKCNRTVKFDALLKKAEALIAPLDEDKIHIKFKEPQMAITPGQAAVLYYDDTVIGGGTIERRVETSDSRKIAGE